MEISVRVNALLGTVFVSGLSFYSALKRSLSRMLVRDNAHKLHLHWVLF